MNIKEKLVRTARQHANYNIVVGTNFEKSLCILDYIQQQLPAFMIESRSPSELTLTNNTTIVAWALHVPLKGLRPNFLFLFQEEDGQLKERYPKLTRELISIPYCNSTIASYNDVLEEVFTKDMLKSGDVLERRDGVLQMYLGFDEGGVLIDQKEGFDLLSDLTDTLESKEIASWDTSYHDYDVISVRRGNVGTPYHHYSINKWHELPVIWRRAEPIKVMTLAEVEKELGYKVRIIDN